MELQAAQQISPRGTRSRSFRRDVSYRAVARYAGQVERFLREFVPERVHIVPSEDLRDDTSRTYGQVLRFLGVNDRFRPGS